MSFSRQLTLLTYNIHHGVGRDGRYDLARIEAVIREGSPDIVALQENDRGIARSRGDDQPRILSERLGMPYFSHAVTRRLSGGDYGLALLSRFPIQRECAYNLSHRRREPRACVRTDIEFEPGQVLHVFNCHLGLSTFERRFQQDRMLSDAILLNQELLDPVVLMGDFNDRPFPVVHRKLRNHFTDVFTSSGVRCGSTFRWGPIRFRLDHIYTSSDIRVLRTWVGNTPLSRLASDHHPLFAVIEVSGQAGWVDGSDRLKEAEF